MVSRSQEYPRATLLWAALAFIAALFYPAVASAQEWECQQCPARDVAVFGIAIPAASSDPQLDLAHHLRMKMTAGGILGTLMTRDPSRDCLTFISDQHVGPDDVIPTQYVAGFEPILPSLGPQQGTDYLITGEITADGGGGYVLTVRLEAAVSREVAFSITIPYEVEAGGMANGERAAEQLMPLMGKIRDFERRKRDTNAGMAIGAFGRSGRNVEVEVIPDKEVIGTGETVGATIRLTDCDDVRLEDKIVATTASGGYLVGEQMPTTDDQGEVRVSFTHDEESAYGVIGADFPFVAPFGRESLAFETGTVYVRDMGMIAELTKTYRMTSRQPLERDMSVPDHTRKVARGSSEETISLQVFMRFDPTPEEIIREFDEEKRTLVDQRYFYNLASYQVRTASYSGADTSFSSTHEAGFLTFMYDYSSQASSGSFADRETNPTLVIDVDASGNVTRVSLPHVEIDLDVVSSSQCTRIEHNETIDCSDTWEWSKSIDTQGGMSGEDECYEVERADDVEIGGGCQIPWRSEDGLRQEDHDFRWRIHGWTRGG